MTHTGSETISHAIIKLDVFWCNIRGIVIFKTLVQSQTVAADCLTVILCYQLKNIDRCSVEKRRQDNDRLQTEEQNVVNYTIILECLIPFNIHLLVRNNRRFFEQS